MPISQNGEAKIVSDFFGSHVGYFIDIGASGGVALSNTFELGMKNWRGLFVEASPIHFYNLVSNYIHRGYFEFVNAALWSERKVMKFNLNAGFYSSLLPKDERGLFMASYWVPTVTPADLYQIQPAADFISLDIEGADMEVFPGLMEHYPNCKLVCVEHANQLETRERWAQLFDRYKLKVIADTPENFIASNI